MKYRKENSAVFDCEICGSSRFGAMKEVCRPSLSLGEYIERELRLETFGAKRKTERRHIAGIDAELVAGATLGASKATLWTHGAHP